VGSCGSGEAQRLLNESWNAQFVATCRKIGGMCLMNQFGYLSAELGEETCQISDNWSHAACG